MVYSRPYYWEKSLAGEKYIMDYRWKERKTKYLLFMKGHALPYDSGNPNLVYTLQDPKDYDLVFDSESPPEMFLERYDVLPNNTPAPLVNDKVKTILEELCPDDVQFFPAMIKQANAKMEPFENHDYWVVNICKVYEDLNWEKSELKYDLDMPKGHQIDGYKRICFNELNGQTIPYLGRLAYFKPKLIIHPELVKRFKKEKIKGSKFIKNSEDGDCWG